MIVLGPGQSPCGAGSGPGSPDGQSTAPPGRPRPASGRGGVRPVEHPLPLGQRLQGEMMSPNRPSTARRNRRPPVPSRAMTAATSTPGPRPHGARVTQLRHGRRAPLVGELQRCHIVGIAAPADALEEQAQLPTRSGSRLLTNRDRGSRSDRTAWPVRLGWTAVSILPSDARRLGAPSAPTSPPRRWRARSRRKGPRSSPPPCPGLPRAGSGRSPWRSRVRAQSVIGGQRRRVASRWGSRTCGAAGGR
jgi:hypothetical protein